MTNKHLLAAEKAEKRYIAATPLERRAMASANGTYALGPHRWLPALGWVKGQSLVLIGFLLRIQEDKTVGSLAWALPLQPAGDTTLPNLLVSLGWNGHVWPPEPGQEEGSWPTDDEEVRGLKYLMAGRDIQRSFTFPPSTKGTPTLLVNVIKRPKVDFGLDPTPYITEQADESRVASFASYAAHPELFLGVEPVAGPHGVELLLRPQEPPGAGHDKALLKDQERHHHPR